MKKIMGIITIGAVIVGIMILKNKTKSEWKNYQKIKYAIEGKEYNLLIADTQEKQKKGLMYVTSLENYDGMIFTYSQPQSLSFWNKNTLVDLDLYWIVNDKVVGKAELPSIQKSKDTVTVTSPKEVDKVVEIFGK
ncbi:MAG: DUF192 domain-containing protein [bacterium]|nr:DUF192 domain-containing protein [bacterium]